MHAKTLAGFKSLLEAERDRLIAEVEEYELEGQENLSDASGENNYRDHMADQGTATFVREIDMTIVDSARERLAQTQRALERLEAGGYGVCLRCGERIAESRLEAVPAAEFCISCKEWEESR
ncbi:MAG: TraR/DksA C4-type zinc finger protein [Coriobacteriia bacterium]